MKKPKEHRREQGEVPSIEFQVLSAPERHGDPAAHSVHLLDRDSDALLFLFEYLSAAGYDVSASSSVDDALMMIGRSRPEVLIAEKDVPEMSGLDLTQRVRALSPATRVILTTERLDPNLGEHVLRLGDVDLIVKPFNWTVLMRAVERALEYGGGGAAGAVAPPLRSRRRG